MTRFIQLHVLTVYPPSNLNRDDSGRPKTAKFGGVERLRISSQALKRALRTSQAFKQRLDGHLGERTARAGSWFKGELVRLGTEVNRAAAIAKTLSALVGTPDDKKSNDTILLNKELFFMAPEERVAFEEMIQNIVADQALGDELAAVAGAVEDDEEIEPDDDPQKKKGKNPLFFPLESKAETCWIRWAPCSPRRSP